MNRGRAEPRISQAQPEALFKPFPSVHQPNPNSEENGPVESPSPHFLSIVFPWASGTLAKQKKLFFLSTAQKEEKAIIWKLSLLRYASEVQFESGGKQLESAELYL